MMMYFKCITIGREKVQELLSVLIQSAIEFPDPAVSYTYYGHFPCTRKLLLALCNYQPECTLHFNAPYKSGTTWCGIVHSNWCVKWLAGFPTSYYNIGRSKGARSLTVILLVNKGGWHWETFSETVYSQILWEVVVQGSVYALIALKSSMSLCKTSMYIQCWSNRI